VDTRETLVAAALKILEREGAAQFSTRAVCSIANVTAPTLYHHFGSADGLLSAAAAEAFKQFLETKRLAKQSSDPVIALRQGWDNYVSFAAERPRLYAATIGRLLLGGTIPAAERGLHLEHPACHASRGCRRPCLGLRACRRHSLCDSATANTQSGRHRWPAGSRHGRDLQVWSGEKRMRLIVTGGSGFLGSRMIRTLVNQDHEVFALARSTSSAERVRTPGATPITGDFGSSEPLSLPEIEAVVHTAAYFRLRDRAHPISAQTWRAHAPS
jgi:AcrR family transcriptional regulator